MIYTFDAGVLIALVNAEPGSDLVEMLLQDDRHVCYVHAANLCEVYYDLCRRTDEHIASFAIADLAEQGVHFRSDMDIDFWQEAGRLKARARRVSLADCFGLTLANRLGAEFVTTDRHELETLTGEYRIQFIR